MNERDAAIIAGLEKPGAGIPLPQLLFSRYIVKPFVAGRSDWNDNAEKFRISADKIISLAQNLDEERLTRRVLVPSQYALEDSSRYWSAAMTLEHIVIVGRGISSIVTGLSNGITPDRAVDTAKVKPKGEMTGAESLALFRDFAVTAVQNIDARKGDLDNGIKYLHPWFGMLSAREWFWFLQAHQFLHLKQLKNIISGLA